MDSRRRELLAGLPVRISAGLVAAVFAVPLTYLVVRNAASPDGLVRSLTTAAAAGPMLRSLLLATSVAIAAAFIGTTAAWLIEHTDLPGRRLWQVALPLPLVFPSFIAAFALQSAFSRGGLLEPALRRIGLEGASVQGFWWAFGILTTLTYPYVLLPVMGRLRTLPTSVVEAGRALGRRPRQVVWSVVVPQVRQATLAGTLLVFLYVVSDFGAVQILRYDTLTRAVYANRLFDQPLALAFALQLAVLALLASAGERAATRPTSAPQATGTPGPVVRLPRSRWAGAVFVAALVSVALVTPIGVLVFWAARSLPSGGLVSTVVDLQPALWSTAWIGVATAVAGVVVVLPLAYLTVRRRSLVGSAANTIVVGGFAVPGIAIALALAFFTLRGPGFLAATYQTHALLVVAYLVHFGALSLRSGQAAIGALSPRVEEAAAALGAGRWRRLRTIELPLAAPGLAAGAGLVGLSVMKELPATLLLSPPGFQTLATKIWSAAEDAFWARASVASLLLVALSALLSWTLVIRRGQAL